MLQFEHSDKEEKIRRIRRFYAKKENDGLQIWMDITSLTYISDKMNLKFKVYQTMDRHKYELAAVSNNLDPKDPKVRYLFRSGGREAGHFNLLYRIDSE